MTGNFACFEKKTRPYYGMALSARPSVHPSVRKQSSRCLHDILWKCILDQDKVSHTIVIVPPFLVSELCPFENRKKSYTGHYSVIVLHIFMNFIGICIRSGQRIIYHWMDERIEISRVAYSHF